MTKLDRKEKRSIIEEMQWTNYENHQQESELDYKKISKWMRKLKMISKMKVKNAKKNETGTRIFQANHTFQFFF